VDTIYYSVLIEDTIDFGFERWSLSSNNNGVLIFVSPSPSPRLASTGEGCFHSTPGQSQPFGTQLAQDTCVPLKFYILEFIAIYCTRGRNALGEERLPRVLYSPWYSGKRGTQGRREALADEK
jgi:hypothetical protein